MGWQFIKHSQTILILMIVWWFIAREARWARLFQVDECFSWLLVGESRFWSLHKWCIYRLIVEESFFFFFFDRSWRIIITALICPHSSCNLFFSELVEWEVERCLFDVGKDWSRNWQQVELEPAISSWYLSLVLISKLSDKWQSLMPHWVAYD